jgi:hypothetical protein
MLEIPRIDSRFESTNRIGREANSSVHKILFESFENLSELTNVDPSFVIVRSKADWSLEMQNDTRMAFHRR